MRGTPEEAITSAKKEESHVAGPWEHDHVIDKEAVTFFVNVNGVTCNDYESAKFADKEVRCYMVIDRYNMVSGADEYSYLHYKKMFHEGKMDYTDYTASFVVSALVAGRYYVYGGDEYSGLHYAVWQHKRVSHDHLQGVIQFKNYNTSMAKAKQCFNGLHPHLEKMTGTPEEAIADAKKEESRVAGPWEHGVYLKCGSNKRKIRDRCEEDPNDLHYDEPSKYRRIHCDSIIRSILPISIFRYE
ncbi:Para-Rep C6 [Camellia lanceoleosa]|uniref:Para-Rep C6 n=1 Tax=Camellia lanceoleosa TaxID=1840588 RepID=A0ACC0IEH7_9ERIC|nr:Para-Rep C6 [Camellia lanceoleosa]